MKIIVYKGKRLLIAQTGEIELLRCAIHLGNEPIGQKRAEGDGRTPEGRYYVCTKNPKSKFHLALGISYPGIEDAEKALMEGRIGSKEHAAIVNAQRERKRPAWDTPLGGYIMIHGEHPEGRTGDWTAGCIAMANSDIEKLYDLAEIGDEIIITE